MPGAFACCSHSCPFGLQHGRLRAYAVTARDALLFCPCNSMQVLYTSPYMKAAVFRAGMGHGRDAGGRGGRPTMRHGRSGVRGRLSRPTCLTMLVRDSGCMARVCWGGRDAFGVQIARPRVRSLTRGRFMLSTDRIAGGRGRCCPVPGRG